MIIVKFVSEVAHCTWCSVDLGLYTTRFKGHGQTMKHRKNDPNGTFKKMMQDVDEVIGNRDVYCYFVRKLLVFKSPA
jgi:hypothetical protein